MPINYIGPSTFKPIFEREYERCSGDYERENPTLVIGLKTFVLDKSGNINYSGSSPIVDSLYPNRIYRVRGFNSQEGFNKFVDSRVKMFVEIERQNQNRNVKKDKELEKEPEQIISELRSVSFMVHTHYDNLPQGINYSPKGSPAMYNAFQDALYFDAFIVFACQFGMIDTPSLLPMILEHELVHHDIGSCKIYEEYRRLFQELKAIQSSGQAQDMNLFSDLIRKSYDIHEKRVKLGIPFLEEALAYNYIHGRRHYQNLLIELLHSSFKSPRKPLELYDELTDRVMTVGRLQTLREVKEVIDQAYGDNRSVFDFYS